MTSLRSTLLAVGALALPAALQAQEAAHEGGSGIFSVDVGLSVWTWVLFLITLGILVWKVFPAIAGSLEERQRKIQDAIDEAAEDREEARRLLAQRQEILQRILELRERIAPDTVFVPSPNDIHQDHQVIAREGLRAFKKQTILGYEEPWNNIVFETRFFVPLEERHVERKVAALRCYETQRARSYLDEEFIRSLARTRGTQLESRYAEAFEVLRMVLPAGGAVRPGSSGGPR